MAGSLANLGSCQVEGCDLGLTGERVELQLREFDRCEPMGLFVKACQLPWFLDAKDNAERRSR